MFRKIQICARDGTVKRRWGFGATTFILRVLAIKKVTLRRWIIAGELDGHHLGREVFIGKAEVQRLFNQRQAGRPLQAPWYKESIRKLLDT